MKKAFSIIEVLVVLGLFAVVSALGLVGFNIVQRNSRDADRKTVLGEIVSKIEDYQKINKAFPATALVEFRETEVVLQGKVIVNLTGSNKSKADTSASGTKYYYEKTSLGFALCAKLESGKIQSAGNLKDGCNGKL